MENLKPNEEVMIIVKDKAAASAWVELLRFPAADLARVFVDTYLNHIDKEYSLVKVLKC